MSRPKKRDGGHKRSSQIWLIILSDMSTNLMLFFLMLFAMTRMNFKERDLVTEGMESAVTNKKAMQQRIAEKEIKKHKEKEAIRNLQDTITYGKLKKYATMTIDDDKIKLTLELPVFFASGSADLAADAQDALSSLVKPIKEFPNDIIIEGHTDNVPIQGGGRYPSNWELSVARAVSVIDYFTKNGVSEKNLVAGGYGEYHPAFPNDTQENKARNRRIEITILRQPEERRL